MVMLPEYQHYLYGSHGPVAVHNVIATTTGAGTTTTSTTRYLHRDHLGSVDAITSETGTLVERLSYDAWGKRRQPNGLDATASISPATTHHGYTGHEHLDGLGLIHMNARVYDPSIGRFTSADPIGFEGGINLYGYAGGNPLTWLDLAGLSPECIAGCHGIPYQPRQPMSPSQELGLNITAIGVSIFSPVALLSRFGSLFRAEEVVTKGIPGIDKPFRAANSAHPPSAPLVDRMNNMKICSGTDCSEIAEKLFNASGGNGKILRVTGANGSDLNLLEYGKVGGGFKYHEVFTDGRYVYDPRLSSSPVPKGDWQQMINGLNPGAKIQ